MLFLSGLTFKWRGRRILLFFLLLSSISPDSILTAQENKLEIESRAFQILEERGEVVLEFFTHDISVVKMVNSIISFDRRTDSGYQAYANLEGYRAFLNLEIPFRIIEKGTARKSASGLHLFPGEWDVYPSHSQYLSYMEGMANDFPGIARLDTIGKSVDGRQILVMKISDNPDAREAEPAFVYSSTMHGDETTGYVLLLRLIDYLCSSYGKDSLVTRLVDNVEIWINPLANPDGTYWQGDSILSLPKRFNSNNADLNRNFPGINGSDHPDNRDYQPENLAQMKFLQSIYMVMGANIHGGEEVVNYPFDTWEYLHSDDKWYRETSREYAEETQKRSAPVLYMRGLDNGITNGFEWYEVEGGRQDWVNYFNHAREVTIEISRDKDPAAADLPFYWHYNYPSMLRYVEHSLFGIQGMIREAGTGLPLKASIWLQEHDGLNSNIFSDTLTGFFARPIQEGTFDLEISMFGYQSEIIRGVNVLKDQTTWVEVELTPLKTELISYHTPGDILAAYISGTVLYIPVNHKGMHRILLYDLNGKLVMEDQCFISSEGIHAFSLEEYNLNPGIYLMKEVSPEGIRIQKIFKTE